MVVLKSKKTAAKKTAAKKTAAKKTTKKTAIKKTTKKTAIKKTTKKTAIKKTTKKTATKKTIKNLRSKVICISHKEDADGISSAALIRQAFGGDSMLVDYPGQMEALHQVVSDEKLKSLYICDLGLSKKTQDEFIELLTSLRKNKVSVTYIDHHDIDPNVVKALEKIKVKVIHDINECTTVQVYNAFKSKLNEHASFVATCAAITDYMEDRPIGSKLLQMYDRQFALISATVLTYNIVGRQREPDYLLYLVEELSESKFPHDIPNTFEFAQIQVEKLSQMIAKVKQGMKTMSNLGYMEILDSGASGAVNFVMGLSEKDVGVAYKERVDHGIYAVSVRGSKNCKVHLGKIVNILATDLGGSGGGHDKACGAVVPKPKIKKFITELNKKIK
jgi:RecJ-like exonuclease